MSIYIRIREGPLGPSKPPFDVDYEDGAPLSFYLPEPLRRLHEITVRLNGRKIEPDRWSHEIPGDNSRISITPISGWVSAILAVVSIAIQVGTWAYNRRRNLMKTRSDRRARIGSSYAFDIMQNETREGAPIAAVFGDHRMAPQILALYTSRYQESIDRINILGGIGHGPIESIADPHINGNDIVSYNGVTTANRLGTLNDASIPDVDPGTTAVAYNTQLLQSAAVVAGGTAQANRFRLKIQMTTGLGYMDNEGHWHSATVSFSLRYRTTAGPGAWQNVLVRQDWQYNSSLMFAHVAGESTIYARKDDNVTLPYASGQILLLNYGSANAEYITISSIVNDTHVARIVLTAGLSNNHSAWEPIELTGTAGLYSYVRRNLTPFNIWIEGVFPSLDTYDVEITKSTANGNGSDRISDPYLKEYAQIQNDVQIFPGIAKAALTAISSEQLSGDTPRITYLIGGLTIMNMTSATTFGAPAKSKNPADVAAAYLFDRIWGCGTRVDTRLELTLNGIAGGPFQVGETVLGPANNYRFQGIVRAVSGSLITIESRQGLPYTSITGQTSGATANITSIDKAHCIDLAWLWEMHEFANEVVPTGATVTTVDADSAVGQPVLNVLSTAPFVDSTKSTTVDANSAAGQAVLNVADTTPFKIDDLVLINPGGAREETKKILTIQPDVSLTMTANLAFLHTLAQADQVQFVWPTALIDYEGAREESGTIASVQSGVSITLATNLVYAHTLAQADEVSPGENRHEFDYVLAGEESAIDFLDRIAKCSRCARFTVGQKHYFRPLRADTPVQLITESSINADSLKVSRRPVGDRITVINGEYLDKDYDYSQRLGRIESPDVQSSGDVIREITEEWYGITRESHVSREMYFLLKLLSVKGKAIQFSMGIQAICFEPHDRVYVGTSLIGHGHASGSIKSSSNSTALLKNDVTLPAGVHTIRVQHANDVIEEQTITTAAGGPYREISISPAVWTANPTENEQYIIGPPGLYRVQSVTPDEQYETAEVVLEEDSDDYYTDDYGVTPTFTESTLRDPNAIPEIVTNLSLAITAQVESDTTVRHMIDVSWTPPDDRDYSFARVYLKELSGLTQEVHKDGYVVGTGNGEFNRPRGICGYGNYVYVCDTQNSRIQRLDKWTLAFSAQFGTFGTGADQFDFPMDIDTDGTFLYIADTGNNRIVRLDIAMVGSGGGTWNTLGSLGALADEFNRPMGIAYSTDLLIVADFNNFRIVKIDDLLLGSVGGTWATIGTQGAGNDQFERPAGVCTDGTNIWVAECAPNDRINMRLFADLSYVAKIGSTGTGDDQFRGCFDLDVNGDTLYVIDADNHRLHVRDASDLSMTDLIGSLGNLRDQFYGPYGICHFGDYVYIAERFNHRIQYRDDDEESAAQWEYIGETTEAQFRIEEGIAQGERYKVAVVSCSQNRVNAGPDRSATAEIVVAQRAIVPPDVTGFTAVRSGTYGVNLSWDALTGSDIIGFEIRFGASWMIGTFLALAPATAINHPTIAPSAGQSRVYRIKAKTRTGVYSTNEATVTYTAPVSMWGWPQNWGFNWSS